MKLTTFRFVTLSAASASSGRMVCWNVRRVCRTSAVFPARLFSPLVMLFWSRTTTSSASRVVRAFVGPSPVCCEEVDDGAGDVSAELSARRRLGRQSCLVKGWA